MPRNYIFIFLAIFLANFALTGLLRKFSLRYNFLNPKGMPLIGGIAIGLTLVSSCFFLPLISKITLNGVKIILLPSLIIFISGIIDDWLELSVFFKFFAQIIAASLLIFLGVRTHIVFIGNAANILITLLWIIGITNAFNLLDVSDGLVAGIAIIVSLSFFAVSVFNGDIKSAYIPLIITASVGSFLIYNLPPAKIYMGNCGSHYLGFLFAAISIGISHATLERKVALTGPIIIMWFPIFDTVFLILMRILKGKSMFRKSNDHFAFRLVKLGYSRNKALLLMFSLTLLFSACGILVNQVSNNYGIAIIAGILVASLMISARMSAIKVDE